MIHTDYDLLSVETVPDYVRLCPALSDIFVNDEPLTVVEVSHGNLNRVFDVRAASDPTRNVIVKQAPPYLNSIGTSWPLDPTRASLEAGALQLYNQLVPTLVPDVYVYDPARYVIVMQNLGEHVTWRQALIEGQMLGHVGRDMGVFLARTLGHTATLMQNPAEKAHLLETFNNPELCQMTLDYVFTLPFQPHDSNCYGREIEAEVVAIQQDDYLVSEVRKMRAQFSTCQQALIHGDLHTGSIMVSASETFVIDLEFAFVGPMSFDIGAVVGNLWLNYAAHEVRTGDPKARTVFQQYLVKMVRDVWQVLVSEMAAKNDEYRLFVGEAVEFDQFARQLLQDTAGMAACKMLRRVIGTSGVEDIRGIEDPNQQAVAARMALNMGRTLLLERYEIKTIDDLIQIATAAAP